MSTRAASDLERDHIAATARIIAPYIRRAPVIEIDGSDAGLDISRVS